MRRQRTPPVFVFAFYVHGLTCLQAKVKLKVAVWPRRCACWPIQTLMASLKGLQRRRAEKSLMNEMPQSLLLFKHFTGLPLCISNVNKSVKNECTISHACLLILHKWTSNWKPCISVRCEKYRMQLMPG